MHTVLALLLSLSLYSLLVLVLIGGVLWLS